MRGIVGIFVGAVSFFQGSPAEAQTSPKKLVETTVLLAVAGKPPITLDREFMGRVPEKNDKKGGWRVRDIVALVLPIKRVDHIVLTRFDGKTRVVDRKLFDKSSIKINKKGFWKYKPPPVGEDEGEGFSPLLLIEVHPRR
jgi:hypothetical protein